MPSTTVLVVSSLRWRLDRLDHAEVAPQLQVNLLEPICSGRSLCLSRLNVSVPSQAEDVWKHAERSEGMLSHIEARGLAQTC